MLSALRFLLLALRAAASHLFSDMLFPKHALEIHSFHCCDLFMDCSFIAHLMLDITLRTFQMSFPFCRGVDRGMGSVFMELGMLVEPTVSPGCPAFRVLVAQLCPIPSNPIDRSLPGSSVCGILQARILEWVAIPFSRGSSQLRDRIWVSYVAGRFFTI